MFATLVALSLLAVAPPGPEDTRPPHPLAPSLPQLTDAEEERLDRVLDRFIQYDTGKLHGTEARKALTDFQQLGPEAIPALVRGLNRAAAIEHSCPVVTIARKLSTLLRASQDAQLLDFVRENVGAGVTATRHKGVLNDVRMLCILRKRVVPPTPPVVRTARTATGLETLSLGELIDASGREQGARLKAVLTELGRRRGDAALTALAAVAATADPEVRKLARDLLERQLGNLSLTDLKAKLKDDEAEVRLAAVRVVAAHKYRLEAELIERLSDRSADVRTAAHQALLRLSRGQDFGPAAEADAAERAEAVRRWRMWWAGQGKP